MERPGRLKEGSKWLFKYESKYAEINLKSYDFHRKKGKRSAIIVQEEIQSKYVSFV